MITFKQFTELDLRIAEIVSAESHPNADKLLVLKINVGDAQKQIVAGIKGHYEPAELVGRKIVVVNNLQPAMLRGVESQGMLLAAQEAGKVVLVCPDKAVSVGAKVS
ncbi:MAG: methionine--tRNA ligase subunit beta [Planctomycetes bacterium]|nr:methionine--tRNA ligase subunit beta [Planctomycetota bacterium]MBM4078936.1 methionine--tRNA ligase subunit beta [Planctomycetota bacterium]MBM4084017.1 methionine--tRNA ligase subunit beta [Planctomycetota bacterium]